MSAEGGPSSSPSEEIADEASGPAGRWILESGTISGSPVSLVPGEEMSLTFRGASITGWSGCGDIAGSVQFPEPGQIRITTNGIPDVPCDSANPVVDFQAAEDFVFGIERYANRWTVDDQRLVLSGTETDLVFVP